MRSLATFLLWVLATAALAVAVPTSWAQHDVVDRAGYSALAASAAGDPLLQQAVAGEITTQVTDRYSVDADLVRGVASAYTASAAFPGQFAQANQLAHDWMFTESATRDGDGWVIDLGPLLNDGSIKTPLAAAGIEVPQSFPVPISTDLPEGLRPGQLRQATTWGPWVSIGASVLAAVFALLTLASARGRGKAFAALGVSALLVGASGWAAIEVFRTRANRALDVTSGDIRQVADVMLGTAIDSLHTWLNLTLAVGGGLVVLGVVAAMLGGLRRAD